MDGITGVDGVDEDGEGKSDDEEDEDESESVGGDDDEDQGVSNHGQSTKWCCAWVAPNRQLCSLDQDGHGSARCDLGYLGRKV